MAWEPALATECLLVVGGVSAGCAAQAPCCSPGRQSLLFILVLSCPGTDLPLGPAPPAPVVHLWPAQLLFAACPRAGILIFLQACPLPGHCPGGISVRGFLLLFLCGPKTPAVTPAPLSLPSCLQFHYMLQPSVEEGRQVPEARVSAVSGSWCLHGSGRRDHSGKSRSWGHVRVCATSLFSRRRQPRVLPRLL